MITDTRPTSTTGEQPLGARGVSLRQMRMIAEAYLRVAGVTRVNDVTGLDEVGIPVFTSVRPRAADGLNTMTSGKGLDAEAAWVSAAMEAIERRFCEPRAGDVEGSYRELSAERLVLDPRKLNLRRGHAWTPDTALEWCATTEMGTGAEVLVPAACVFTPYADPHAMMTSSTIGLASGSNTKEALVHGLYEVLEHDATAFGEVARTGYRIAPETLPERPARLVAQFEAADIDTQLYWFPGRTGVPTVYVTIRDRRSRDPLLINGGAGCDASLETAALRALCEAAQSRLIVIAGSREDLDQETYRRQLSYTAAKERLAGWAQSWPGIVWDDIPVAPIDAGASVEEHLRHVAQRLRDAGLPLLLARVLSGPGDPLSVVRVVVPGIEFTHLDRRRCGPAMTAALAASSPDGRTS